MWLFFLHFLPIFAVYFSYCQILKLAQQKKNCDVLTNLFLLQQINNELQDNHDPLVIKTGKPQSRRSIQNTTPIVLFPPIPQETVRLENETAQAILEKRKPDNIRRILDSFLTPMPIVDRITNDEKYGNTGDKFIGIGGAIVNGYEKFSNFLNVIVDVSVYHKIVNISTCSKY